MKYFLSALLTTSCFFLFGQAFYDFESGIQGWNTYEAPATHLGAPGISSSWILSTQTGGTAPLLFDGTWYGNRNAGQRGAERSWILSPTLYANQSNVSINFDSYTSNEGGSLYDRERIHVSINGGPYQMLHSITDPDLHGHVDRTFRNITFDVDNVSYGDKLNFRILMDTGDGVVGGLDRSILGWYVDNILIDGVDEIDPIEASISISDPVLYYGYAPLSCTSLTASSTGGFGEVTYSWIVDDDIQYGASLNLCADGPACAVATLVAEDEAGNTAEMTIIIDVVDVSCSTNGNNPKVSVCHNHGAPNQKTLCISSAAVAAHLAHGDHLGDCDSNLPCTTQALVQQADQDGSFNEVSNQENTLTTDAPDFFVPLTDISTIAVEDKRAHIYPNPASNRTNINFHQAITGQVAIELYNQLGQLMLRTTQNVNSGDLTEFNLSNLKPGIYQLKLILEGNTFYTKQLVIMK